MKANRLDPFALSEKLLAKLPSGLPTASVRRRMLDVLLNVGIPFNRWLGLRISELSREHVVIQSPPTRLRRNHVGTAHACAQALIGEYAAGLVIAQNFPIETYRVIIGKLEVEYKKSGNGVLFGTSRAPTRWPELENDEGWVEMETQIRNEAGDEVSLCRTRWQIKSWARIDADRKSRS